MKLFVAFHYHEEDKWITELVFPIIKALDITILTGEDIYGKVIREEVKNQIKKSDAVIAFITKSWRLYPWVRDELLTAPSNIPAVEIRDVSIKGKTGILEGTQRLDFDSGKKEVLLVKLVELFCKWKKNHDSRSLLMLPDDIMEEASPYIDDGYLTCTYRFKDGHEFYGPYETKPFRVAQGLAIDIKNIPSKHAIIQIKVTGPKNFSWSCPFQAFDSFPINLKRD